MPILKSKPKENEEEGKNCNICKMNIDDNEHYCELRNHNNGKETSIDFYHAKCFRDKFLKSNQLNKNLSKTNELLGKMSKRFLE